jgi:segregation and condensation protein B
MHDGGDWIEVEDEEAASADAEKGPAKQAPGGREAGGAEEELDLAEEPLAADGPRAEGDQAPAGHGVDGADPREEQEEQLDARGPGPGADLSDEELRRRLAALLFAAPEPLSVGRLVALLERPPSARVRAALDALGHALDAAGLPFQVRGLKGGYTLLTSPELGHVVARLAKGPTVERISAAALETLAIVAYRQPVTKAEIEAIRGVQAGPILRTLVDRGLVKIVGRADVPGHPLQYGTGKEFLDRFGLLSLDELPRDAELARG